MKKEIAVIIPTYKAHDTIKSTLYSIAMQKAVTYKCYIVVDGEKKGSYDYLNELLDIDLEILYMKKNGGVGLARQYGIDHSTEPFISIIDSDDTYLSALALYNQRKPLDDENMVMTSSDFLQEMEDHTLRLKEKNMVWMHGKMYRRSYLDKYDIRFNEERANEDVGFNTQCLCYINEKEQIYFGDNITYLWQFRGDSTVRNKQEKYEFDAGIDGFARSLVYAIERVLTHKDIDINMEYVIVTGLGELHQKHTRAKVLAPKQLKHIEKWARYYYDRLYCYLDDKFIADTEESIIKKLRQDYKGFLKFKDKITDLSNYVV